MLYNGLAIAVVTLMGALTAYGVSTVNSKFFDKFDVWLIVVCSALQGGLVLLLALTDNMVVAYVTYCLCGTIYYFLITVAR